MDFRKADPTYTNFKPTSAEDAINLFHRHKSLGVPPHLWPEVFVTCAASLPDEELHKFQDWLVNPQGEPTGAMLLKVDEDNERLRKQLLKEAQARDKPPPIDEHYMEMDDEKAPLQPPEVTLSTPPTSLSALNLDEEKHDFEMVTPSER